VTRDSPRDFFYSVVVFPLPCLILLLTLFFFPIPAMTFTVDEFFVFAPLPFLVTAREN